MPKPEGASGNRCAATVPANPQRRGAEAARREDGAGSRGSSTKRCLFF